MLKDHNPGERMTGVAVAKKSSQPREAIMRDLEQFQPEVKRRQIKLPKNFVLQLRGQEEKISFDQIFTRTNPRFPYILVRRMKFVLTPLSSFFDTFTNVNVMVLDTRMLNRPKRQTTVLNSNVDYRGNLSLDYCFPIASISKLFLYLNLEVVLMEAGEEWATVLVQVEAEEMDFPVMEEFQPISVVAHLPPSGLQRYKYDPTHMNLTIRDSHRKKLLELYETGDLADTTKPILNKTGRAKYSSTTFQSTHAQPMPQIGPIDWSGMQVMGRQNEEEMSITPPETGSVRSGGSVDLAKEKMLKKPIVVEEPESDEGGSLLSFEKEAAKNAELNKSVVKFQVASVRE
nr:MAG: movement protein [Yunnan phenui-like virus]